MRADDPALEALVDAASRELDAVGVRPGKSVPPAPRFGPYHEAAAVVATFDKATLRPVSKENEAPVRVVKARGIDALLADSKLVRDVQGRERWALRTDIRREVLRELGDSALIERALAGNAASRPSDDPAQEMFEAYLRGTAPPLEEQTARQVTGTFQVVEWLEGLGLVRGLPEREAVRRRSERLALLQPFFDLAGEHFAGRVEQLARLRAYVGVMPPGSVRERLSRIAATIFDLKEKPPLVIWGPGGLGKSTLMARFIWEHATLSNTERFPWAFLDFDRPGLLAEEPLTLLIEAVRQLGIQYPEAAEFSDRIRRAWLAELGERPAEIKRAMTRDISRQESEQATSLIGPDEQDRYLRDFGALLGNLKVETDPFLLVLDTFEQVQYRSEVVVKGLCAFLERFQKHVPRLRTVIAGRATLAGLSPFPTEDVPLGDFDEAAAMGYLARKGVSVPEIAKRLYDQVGGNPLSLRLAAEEWERSGGAGLQDLRTRTLFGFRVQENEVQAQLFARVLSHIHDPDVRRLAYPGLVLRRVTGDMIQKVLAEPCGVVVPDAAAARRLFDEMAREVALVTIDGDALVHRADVRRLVLRLLREREVDKVGQIENAAVAYYASRDGLSDLPPEQRLRERAEELYHRLSLQQPLDVVADRWLVGVEPYLFAALDELSVRERAWLATRVGRTLTEEERRQADLDGWERDTSRRVRHLLRQGQPREALAALRERTERLPGTMLYALEAEVSETLGEWSDVHRVVEVGIRSADEAGQRDLAILLRIRGARADLQGAALAAAHQKLDEAESLLDAGMAFRAIEVGLHRLALLRAEHASDNSDPGGPAAAAPVRQSLKSQFESISDDDVADEPELMAWVAAEIGADHPEVLQRIVRLTGLGTKSPGRLRALALALTALDAAQPVAGTLADKVSAPPADSLTERWTRFTLSARSAALGVVVADLMADIPVTPVVTSALVDVLRERARRRLVPGDALALQEQQNALEESAMAAGRTQGNSQSPPVSSSAALRLNGPLMIEFQHALLSAFPTREALAQMVRFKLDRNLESIAPTHDLTVTVQQLIDAAHSQAWSAQLLAAARESNPGDADLQQFAAKFGLATALPDRQALQRVLTDRGTFVDVEAWRTRLGTIEAQVCRVEVALEGGTHASYGTGFLVGRDLLMTAFHVVERVVRGHVSPHDVVFRFDYKRLAGGPTVHAGTPYRLSADDWLVDYSPYGAFEAERDFDPEKALDPEQLNYALLRLARPAGADPVGGDRAEPSAPPRRWLEISRRDEPPVGAALAIVQHPRGEPLKVAFGSDALLGFNANRTRCFYRIDTEPGSSGAPCLDADWELVAMHLAADARRGFNVGVPMPAILRRLESRGLADLRNQRLL